MSLLQRALREETFAVTTEMAPPKGVDTSERVETALLLRGKVHGINVTDMQSACLRASALGLAIHLKQAGCEPILQLTGRDRNRMAILGDALSAASFGVDTVLSLTGDHPALGDCRGAKAVYDLDSVGILGMLRRAEESGVDCGGNPLPGGGPTLFKGAVASPVYKPMDLQILRLRQKVDAGAEFIQTQGVFALESLRRFMDAVDTAGIHIPVLAGIIPLRSARAGAYMNEHVAGIQVPEEMLRKLSDAETEGRARGVKGLPAAMGQEMAAGLMAEIRASGVCQGVHIMTVGAERTVPDLLEMAGIAI